MFKSVYKYFTLLSKSYAYTKLMQKTGLTPVELDLYKQVYKYSSKAIETKASIFLYNFLPAKYAKFI